MSVRLRSQSRIAIAAGALLVAFLGSLFAPAPSAHADVENFSYESWYGEYFITQDDEGRARVAVRETVVAEFPEHDQNKGMVRGLPLTYQGAPSKPEHLRVTDEYGASIPFFTETGNGFYVILTGDDTYVHGQHTYVFEYEIPDVVFEPDNSSAQEFYWDLAPVSHEQPIRHFQAVVAVDEALSAQLTGTTACYQGSESNTGSCTEFREADTQFTVGPTPLQAHETVTMALEFAPNTVTQPPQRIPNVFLDTFPVAVVLFGLLSVIVGLGVIIRAKWRSRDTGTTTVAQYDVPAHLPPLLVAQLGRVKRQTGVTAEILHLAIQGLFRIENKKPQNKKSQNKKKLKTPETVLKRTPTQINTPPSEELDAIDVMAYKTLFPGKARELIVATTLMVTNTYKIDKHARQEAYERDYLVDRRHPFAQVVGLIGIGAATAGVYFAIVSLNLARNSGLLALAIVLALLVISLGVVCLVPHRHFTPSGAQTWQYANGVRLFIKTAEQDRIAMLQSFEGAERTQTETGAILELYERLLPYAVVFGKEKSWGSVLERQYQYSGQDAPKWFPSIVADGTTSMQSSLSSLSSSMSNAASISSSSSGAGGGGFAGGGGGGGFAGGR